jgi:AraC family transcriptional regulator
VLERWNDAMDVLEGRLAAEGGVDVAELARVALTSEYHFRRVFSVLAGMPISEYVRRRRVTVATAAILDGERVLDVALSHGYGSGDAFTRAFKAVHGITPEQARRPGARLVSQPRMRFRLTVEGTSTVRHRIVERDAFRLLGRHARLPLVYRGDNTAMIEFHRGLPEGLDDRLLEYADVAELPGLVASSSGFEDDRADGSRFDYHHAVATTRPAGELPDDLDVLEVAAGSWAVFEGGSDDGNLQAELQNLWATAYGDWLPANPYRVVPGPEILDIVEQSDHGASGRGELWLPVEREKEADQAQNPSRS